MANLITAKRSTKNVEIASILSLIGGWAGLHYFYVGRYGRGIFYLITLGGFGTLWLWDFYQTASGNLYDKDGNRVMNKMQARIYNEANTIYE